MSVLAKNRKESNLRVLTFWEHVREEFHRLYNFNFGFDEKLVINQVRCNHGIYEKTDEMKPERLDMYRNLIIAYKENAFKEIDYSKEYIMDGFRQVSSHIFIANSIYPTCVEELSLRRCHQDEALGICYSMLKELEYIMRALPVKTKSYPRYIEMINTEITYLKAWKSSNNKFKVTNNGSVIAPSSNYSRFKPKAGKHNGPLAGDTSVAQGSTMSVCEPEEIMAVPGSNLTKLATKLPNNSNRVIYSNGKDYSTGLRKP